MNTHRISWKKIEEYCSELGAGSLCHGFPWVKFVLQEPMFGSARRVSPDQAEVRISFSLQESPDLQDAEDSLRAFPDLEHRLQPVPPCVSLRDSVQVYRDHCRMALELHQVKHDIAVLEARKRELLAELVEDERVAVEIVRLEEEFRLLSEENRTLLTVHTERAQKLETLSLTNQDGQGSL